MGIQVFIPPWMRINIEITSSHEGMIANWGRGAPSRTNLLGILPPASRRPSLTPALQVVANTLLLVLFLFSRRRPYRVECTGSLLTSEVKRRRARLVLGWGTAWEDLRVLSAFMHPAARRSAPSNAAAQATSQMQLLGGRWGFISKALSQGPNKRREGRRKSRNRMRLAAMRP